MTAKKQAHSGTKPRTHAASKPRAVRARETKAPATRYAVVPTRTGMPVRGRFDVTVSSAENRLHWANADYLSADAAASPAVRRKLRAYARYEGANNTYCRGVIETLANDTIGRGPRLQMLTDNEGFNERCEAEFAKWDIAVEFPDTLRTMRKARAQDGEAFALMVSNPEIDASVKLALRLAEADRFTSPDFPLQPSEEAVDGIRFDSFGNPAVYYMLRTHPGGDYALPGAEYDKLAAKYVIHWFRRDRPEQRRGIPDIMAALPLFALLRRYGLAVITAAEAAANISLVMKTTMPSAGAAAQVDPWEEMALVRDTALFAPEGWEPSQMKAEQPSTTYDMGKREFLKEIGRCLNMPYCVVAGDSSDYNYASGRLDWQTYLRSIAVDQASLERVCLNRVLAEWAREAAYVYDWWVPGIELKHQWFWDGREHVDPLKEANAQDIGLGNGTRTLAGEAAKLGHDWQEDAKQRAKEFGITLKEYQAILLEKFRAGGASTNHAQDADTDEEEPLSKSKTRSGGNGNGKRTEGRNRVAEI